MYLTAAQTQRIQKNLMTGIRNTCIYALVENRRNAAVQLLLRKVWSRKVVDAVHALMAKGVHLAMAGVKLESQELKIGYVHTAASALD